MAFLIMMDYISCVKSFLSLSLIALLPVLATTMKVGRNCWFFLVNHHPLLKAGCFVLVVFCYDRVLLVLQYLVIMYQHTQLTT